MKDLNLEQLIQQIKLEQLIQQIKELPPESREARKLKNKLVHEIQKSHLIGIPKLKQLNIKHGIAVDLSDEDIDELRLFALGETLNRTDEYNPLRFNNVQIRFWAFLCDLDCMAGILFVHVPVMVWINYKVKSIYLTERNKRYRSKVQAVSLDAPLNSESTTTLGDCLPAPAPSDCLFREFIKEDPEGILKKTKMKNCDVSLQQILLLLLDDCKWKEIANKLQVAMGSVNSFYTRCLKNQKIRDYFKENEFGLQ
ncbi:MAG: hypothetical protein AAF630_00080 [Cyanobacteria bacterium P01_C01_bin.38]